MAVKKLIYVFGRFKKCWIFGLVFSVDGIRLLFDKTKALKEAKPLTKPSEVSGLLRLSTYCSRFI